MSPLQRPKTLNPCGGGNVRVAKAVDAVEGREGLTEGQGKGFRVWGV